MVSRQILREDDGNELMREIAAAIQEGAAAFLRREYTFLAGFVAVVFVVLVLFIDYDILDRFGPQNGNLTSFPRTGVSYVIGAAASALAGFVGMYIAVRSNVRTAAEAREGLNPVFA